MYAYVLQSPWRWQVATRGAELVGGNTLSAGPYSGKQRRLSLAAGWPGQFVARSILEDNIIGSVGQLYPATGSATRMVISSSISRAASLERLARGMIGAEVCTDPLWCAMLGGARSGAGDGAHGTGERASSLVIEHMQWEGSWAISAAFDELMGAVPWNRWSKPLLPKSLPVMEGAVAGALQCQQ